MKICKVKYPVVYILETRTESACMRRSFQQKVGGACLFFFLMVKIVHRKQCKNVYTHAGKFSGEELANFLFPVVKNTTLKSL